MQRSQRIIETLEEKLSNVKEECVDVKERLNRALLEKEVTEQEKSHLSEVLSRTELQKAEVEMEVNKVKTEEIALKDALIKLQSLNEALGHDKAELTRMIRHMEMERETLGNEKNEIEQEKISIREELIRVEQEKVSIINHCYYYISKKAFNISKYDKSSFHIDQSTWLYSSRVPGVLITVSVCLLYICLAVNASPRLAVAGEETDLPINVVVHDDTPLYQYALKRSFLVRDSILLKDDSRA